MAIKSKGRGTAAAFGLLLLLAGLVGGGVLYWQSIDRPSEVVDGLARAPIGCTTTLRFTETGTFYVFEDIGPMVEAPAGGCEPSADPDQTFAFELTGPDGPVVPKAEQSLSYDTDDHVGSSVARFEVTVLGEYEIVVVGDDESVVAAIGRDPDDGVDDLRQRAIVVAIVGVVLGLLLLVLAGHRSKHAASFAAPDGPGWGPQPTPDDHLVAHERSAAVRSPVNPHQPDQQVAIARPLSDVNEMLAQPPTPKPASPWGPPVAGEAAPDQPAIAPVDADEDEQAADEHEQAADDHDGAADDHDGAADEHEQAADEHEQAADDHDGAADEHEQAADDHDGAADEHEQAADDHDGAADEHEQAADGLTDRGGDEPAQPAD